ncbi:bifunctional glycosyltransferase/CDP-glycerol:glycerophosphate glycerophosphotransferase [Nocardioides sp. SYSU DS0651]|uniref:bifunctional glycosyltransferase/CDP-glycerol:glycerophosphate glycerophosphotransferase n=1 Tax=Nocardioides sp. SYSU DS0651 TaxID=3415955 RepID=UPI003F4C270C
MAYDRVRTQQALIRLAKSAPGRMRGPVGRVTRRFRSDFSGPLVTVVLPVSDEETTRIGPLLEALRAQLHRNLDIVVVPYGRHDRVLAVARRHAAEDWRIRVRRREEGSLAAARNAGVAAARAELVLVVAGGDDLLPRSISRLVSAHEESGSPLVVGRMKEPAAEGRVPDSPYDAAHHVDLRRTTLERSPVAITDLGIGNKLFARRLWDDAGIRFTDGLPSGTDVAVGLLRSATTFDLLKEWTYVPTGRQDGVGLGTTPDVLSGLADWIERHERTWREVEALGLPPVRDWWLWGVLDAAVQPLVADVERADDRQWTTLRDHVSMLLAAADAHVWSTLSAESRVKLWLLQHDHRAELEQLVAERIFAAGNRPTAVRDGRVWAQLPFHDDEKLGVPPELYEMTADETRLRATLREVRWVAPERIELLVLSAIDFVHMTGLPTVECALVDRGSGRRLELPVRQERDWRGNQGGRRYQDFSWGAFVATVPVAELVALTEEQGLADAGRTWSVEVTLTVDGVTRSGPITMVDDQASAGFLGQNHLAPRRAAGAVVGFTPPSTAVGLTVQPDVGPRLRSFAVDGRSVSGVLDPAGVPVVAVRAVLGSQQARSEVTRDRDGLAFRLVLPAAAATQRRWSLHALTADGRQHPVAWPESPDQWLGVGGGDVVATRDAAGMVELRDAHHLFVVDEVAVDDLDVTVSGRWLAARPPAGARLELVGAKAAPEAVMEPAGAGVVRARFRLVTDPWGLGETPVPHGWYWFTVRDGGQETRALLGERAVDQLHRFMIGGRYAARVVRAARDCGIELTRPLTGDERGPYAQAQLEQWSREGEIALDEQAVYLQSYGGASATDSQLAIHEELRRTRPDLTLYWGVIGSPSWVPEGGVPVVINSREYYRVLASAKYLCMNVDPPRWFDRRPGQRLLQTFHGYPAKSMGLRMWRAKHYTPRRIQMELERTSGEWDLILTPAPEMDEHYRREYAYDGPILSEGYPRDDLLVSERAEEVRTDTRRRLGIKRGQKVVLYAPTWRDDLASSWGNAEMVHHLDLEAASRALGPDYVLLMRGHRFHSPGSSPLNRAGTARFLDVTDYPEINHLILAADAAVLDYSSLRFDFALTMRPMIFLVPDLDSYVGGVRGFLYDFRDSAPGPLVDTADEAVRLLRDLPGLTRRCAPDLARFHDTYNYLQDGHAARRVVERFFA